jgi:succinate dehydrogenase / fumarate reductase iron-sulfur subunit
MKRFIAVARTSGGSARTERFEVDYDERTTVLDALETIRTGRVPELAYRHSCHHGSCGTCGVRIDGREVLACLTTVASLSGEAPLVEPLARFDVVADLATDPGRLFRSLPDGATYLRASDPQDSREAPPGGDGFVRFEDCIECGCCVSACPASDRGFQGPAALAAVRREMINRPERAAEMRALAARPDGVAACERHLDCSRVCPRAVYPAKHIQLLRREIAAEG